MNEEKQPQFQTLTLCLLLTIENPVRQSAREIDYVFDYVHQLREALTGDRDILM